MKIKFRNWKKLNLYIYYLTLYLRSLLINLHHLSVLRLKRLCCCWVYCLLKSLPKHIFSTELLIKLLSYKISLLNFALPRILNPLHLIKSEEINLLNIYLFRNVNKYHFFLIFLLIYSSTFSRNVKRSPCCWGCCHWETPPGPSWTPSSTANPDFPYPW